MKYDRNNQWINIIIMLLNVFAWFFFIMLCYVIYLNIFDETKWGICGLVLICPAVHFVIKKVIKKIRLPQSIYLVLKIILIVLCLICCRKYGELYTLQEINAQNFIMNYLETVNQQNDGYQFIEGSMQKGDYKENDIYIPFEANVHYLLEIDGKGVNKYEKITACFNRKTGEYSVDKK